MIMDFSKHYSLFLKQNEGLQHFACHSHYYWPDVTRDAMLRYWDDSAKMVDSKWDHIFGTMLPAVQKQIAGRLNLSQPERIVFAPNTHELVYRLFSCFEPGKQLKVVCSDSEFYSFKRQIDRMKEFDWLHVKEVPAMPFDSFADRFMATVQEEQPDLVFFSHVFFNSGVAVKEFNEIIQHASKIARMVAMDAYHGFMAVPTDLSGIEDKVFYLGGSYKYAQGGEGLCFMYSPPGKNFRPAYTGWFAEFGDLHKPKDDVVAYSTDGMHYAGATMDYTGLYRIHATLELFDRENISMEVISSYIRNRQAFFLKEIDKYDHPYINRAKLLMRDPEYHGGFLTFRFDDPEQVSKTAAFLKQNNIITDFRADRLRFGFALYHQGDYDLSCLPAAAGIL